MAINNNRSAYGKRQHSGASGSGSQTIAHQNEEIVNRNNKKSRDLTQVAFTLDNNLHPLYLDNNDQSEIQLISKKLIGSENYNPWLRSMTIALSAKNKLGIVNGLYDAPPANTSLFVQWERVNDMIVTWILNCVSHEISNSMSYVNDAQSLWKELKESFSTVDGHGVYQLLKDIHSLEQGTASVDFYYHKLKGLWDEYLALETPPTCVCRGCTCDIFKAIEEQDQRRKLAQFLMGLDDSFSNIRGQILIMQPLPTVAQAFSMVKRDERLRQGYIHENQNSTALMARESTMSDDASSVMEFSENGKAFNVQTYGNRNFISNRNTWCNHCNRPGHTKETCYKIHGYPTGHPAANRRNKTSSNIGNSGNSLGTRPTQKRTNNFQQQRFSYNTPRNMQNGKAMLGQDNNILGSTAADNVNLVDTVQQLQAQMSQLFNPMEKLPDSPEDHITEHNDLACANNIYGKLAMKKKTRKKDPTPLINNSITACTCVMTDSDITQHNVEHEIPEEIHKEMHQSTFANNDKNCSSKDSSGIVDSKNNSEVNAVPVSQGTEHNLRAFNSSFSQETAMCNLQSKKKRKGKSRGKSMNFEFKDGASSYTDLSGEQKVKRDKLITGVNVLCDVDSADNVPGGSTRICEELIASGEQSGHNFMNVFMGRSLGGCFRRKLLILDLNGLLADIVQGNTGSYKGDGNAGSKKVFKRPFCEDFLQFCFERYTVGVWSSRRRENVDEVIKVLMGEKASKLAVIWDQDHCTETGYNTLGNAYKPLYLKEIVKLWENNDGKLPWKKGDYDQSNTLLLDDSPYKALRNPPNTAIFPNTYQYRDQKDNSLGPGGDLRVYLDGLALAEDVQEYVKANPFGQRPITKSNPYWNFYVKVMGQQTSKVKQRKQHSIKPESQSF